MSHKSQKTTGPDLKKSKTEEEEEERKKSDTLNEPSEDGKDGESSVPKISIDKDHGQDDVNDKSTS
jgi:hypothetical protein